MSDITLTPIPYNGGTLSLTNANSHICHLSGNRFFALFSQAAPNMLFAATFDVNDLHNATPVITVVKQRMVGTDVLTRCRVWKLNSTTVLALVNTDLRVYEVQANGDVVLKPATSLAFHSNYLWGTESATTYGIGTFLHGQYIKDNVVWFVQRATSTSAIVLFKLVYDSGAGTLTKTVIQTLAASTTATHFWRPYIHQLPGTTNYIVYGVGGNTTYATSTISAYYIFTEDGGLVTSQTTAIPTTVKALVPLQQNKVLGILDAKTYVVFNGSSWTTDPATFAPTYFGSSIHVSVEALSAQHFILVSTAGTDQPYSGSWYYRIAKYVSPLLGQTSAATKFANGSNYQTTNIYYDQQATYRIDNYETFLNFGRVNATTFSVRVLYQAA